jgi:hypothetical protein
MTIRFQSAVYADGGALVIYTGTANRSVEWSLTGSGTLTPITEYTDHTGQAAARYVAGTPGDTVTIQVTAGA